MKKLTTLTAIILLIGLIQTVFAETSDFEIIKKRVIEEIMNNNSDESRVGYPVRVQIFIFHKLFEN
jgi:hypothetical protein